MFYSDARVGSEEARDISVDDFAQPQGRVRGGNENRNQSIWPRSRVLKGMNSKCAYLGQP